MYDNGQGVTKDESEAVKWFRKAAEQDVAAAQFNLALKYFHGKGVPKDYTESYKWLLLCSAQNYEKAKKTVPALERDMTREQMAEGQKLAREFKPLSNSQAN